jgi:hypothetical protein
MTIGKFSDVILEERKRLKNPAAFLSRPGTQVAAKITQASISKRPGWLHFLHNLR